MSDQIIFLVPEPSIEFKLRFSSFENSVFIEKVQDLSEIDILKSDFDKILVVDPDFVDWDLDKAKLTEFKNLKSIFLLSTSFSWVDLDFANESKIKVNNVRNWSTNAVSDWVILNTLSLLRKTPIILKGKQEADFDNDFLGSETKNRTFGIIGLGNIGLAVAQKASSLGAKVKFWSASKKDTDFEKVSLEEIFNSCDVIVPCIAQNEQTEHLITDDLIQSMNQNSVFVSVIHHFYNHNLILDLVKNKKIAGYSFEESNKNLSDFEGNIWVTPEYAWFTKESLENLENRLFENLEAWQNNQFPNAVN
jgi:glycerate dehydrogenase